MIPVKPIPTPMTDVSSGSRGHQHDPKVIVSTSSAIRMPMPSVAPPRWPERRRRR